jgi:LysR family hydrogen peroxide-inducible transcriptional activator
VVNFRDMIDKTRNAKSQRCEVVYKSDRDDWVLAMVASGFGFGVLPEHSITNDGISARPLVDPEVWRSIHLVTVRDKPQSYVVGALVHEAMRTEWAKEDASPINARLTVD